MDASRGLRPFYPMAHPREATRHASRQPKRPYQLRPKRRSPSSGSRTNRHTASPWCFASCRCK